MCLNWSSGDKGFVLFVYRDIEKTSLQSWSDF